MSPVVPDEAEALLTGEPLVAHLGTCHDGGPHVAPLWYAYREGHVDVATTRRTLANLRENPRVALSVQKDENGRPRWGVVVRGTATVIDDEEERRSVLHRINRRYGVDDDAWSGNTPVRIDVGSVDYWTY
ncbi:MAG: pyridoxamine 5'-phosphate oxidase family protein [Haloferacaceae archaeon]